MNRLPAIFSKHFTIKHIQGEYFIKVKKRLSSISFKSNCMIRFIHSRCCKAANSCDRAEFRYYMASRSTIAEKSHIFGTIDWTTWLLIYGWSTNTNGRMLLSYWLKHNFAIQENLLMFSLLILTGADEMSSWAATWTCTQNYPRYSRSRFGQSGI